MQEAFAEACGVGRTYKLRLADPDGYSPEKLLDRLRTILAREGRISRKNLDADIEGPSTNAYINRFGALRAAYALAGYDRTPSELCRDAQRALKDHIAMLHRLRRERKAQEHAQCEAGGSSD